MRRAQIGELPQRIRMRFQSARRAFALGEKGEPVIDHIVGKDLSVGILRRFRGIETQHVVGIGHDLLANGFGRSRFRAPGQEYTERLFAVLRLREYEAEWDIRQQIAVIVDVEPVNDLGVERVSIRIGVQDDGSPA